MGKKNKLGGSNNKEICFFSSVRARPPAWLVSFLPLLLWLWFWLCLCLASHAKRTELVVAHGARYTLTIRAILLSRAKFLPVPNRSFFSLSLSLSSITREGTRFKVARGPATFIGAGEGESNCKSNRAAAIIAVVSSFSRRATPRSIRGTKAFPLSRRRVETGTPPPRDPLKISNQLNFDRTRGENGRREEKRREKDKGKRKNQRLVITRAAITIFIVALGFPHVN